MVVKPNGRFVVNVRHELESSRRIVRTEPRWVNLVFESKLPTLDQTGGRGLPIKCKVTKATLVDGSRCVKSTRKDGPVQVNITQNVNGKMLVQVKKSIRCPSGALKEIVSNAYYGYFSPQKKLTKTQEQTRREWNGLARDLVDVALEENYVGKRVSVRRRLPALSREQVQEMLDTLPSRRLIQTETQQLAPDSATELDAPSLLHEKAGHAVLFSLSLLAGYLCLRCMRARRTKTDEEN